MYFMGQIWGCSFIFNTSDEYLTIGPFESESDGELMCELLNSGKLMFKGELNGKEDLKESHPIY